MGDIQYLPEEDNYPEGAISGENIGYNISRKESLDSLAIINHIAPSLDDQKHLPKALKESFWSLINPSSSFTFNDDKDRADLDLHMTACRLSHQMNKHPLHQKPSEFVQIDNIRLEAENNFKRSIGAKKGKINQIALAFTHITQSISTNIDGNMNRGISWPGNKFKRILG